MIRPLSFLRACFQARHDGRLSRDFASATCHVREKNPEILAMNFALTSALYSFRWQWQILFSLSESYFKLLYYQESSY